jgi:hypothetical protein
LAATLRGQSGQLSEFLGAWQSPLRERRGQLSKFNLLDRGAKNIGKWRCVTAKKLRKNAVGYAKDRIARETAEVFHVAMRTVLKRS